MAKKNEIRSKEYMSRYDAIADTAFAIDAIDFFDDPRDKEKQVRPDGDIEELTGDLLASADKQAFTPEEVSELIGKSSQINNIKVNGGSLFGPTMDNISRFGEFGGGSAPVDSLDMDGIREQLRKILRTL